MSAEIIGESATTLILCVPKSWTGQQAITFAEMRHPHPAGESWKYERSVQDCDCIKPSYKHITLDA